MTSFPRALALVLLLLVVAVFLGRPGSAAAQCATPTFNTALTWPVGTGPTAIASGDLNGDGNADLVTANTGSASLSTLFGNGWGRFGTATNIPVGNGPTAVAIAQFNSDGKLDLVSVNRDSGSISILLNNGTGGFAVTANYAAGASPRSVAVADFNNDNKQDLVVAEFASGSIIVYFGDGNGNFPTSTSFAAGSGTNVVATADLNNDGKPDIAATNFNSSNVTIFLGNGSGGFSSGTNFLAGGRPTAIIIANYNLAGVDLVIGTDREQVYFLSGVGNGSFGEPYIFQRLPAGFSATHLTAADLNADGAADLVVSDPAAGARVYLGYDVAVVFPMGAAHRKGIQPWATAVADFNHDNRLDLATVNFGSNDVATFQGDGVGNFLENDLYGTSGAGEGRSLAVTDFNNDGKTDFALLGAFGVSFRKNDGTGRFVSQNTDLALSNSPVAIASGDFNSDTNIDLVVANQTTNNVTVLRGNGLGNFVPSGDFPAGLSPTWLTVGDFNRDGQADLAVTNRDSDNVSILLGTGTGSFAAPTNFAAGTRPGFVTGADLNNDGDFDLVVSNPDTDNISVLLGNGAGGFAPATSVATGDHPTWVAAADLNGDGNGDLAVGIAGAVSVMNGNGLGGFSSLTNYPVGTQVSSVAISDFNGDTKLDLAVGDSTSTDLAILQNSGTGTFGAPIPIPTGGKPSFVVLGEFNGDLAVDLAVAHGVNTRDNNANGAVDILLNACAASLGHPAVPSLVINDLSFTEGDAGTSNAILTVNLSQPSNQTVSVSYFTKGQTAVSGVDFQPVSGRIVFAPGQTSRTIAVPIIGDTLEEFNEIFSVSLAAPINAPMLDGKALVTILDNEPMPSVSIADLSLLEGDGSSMSVNFIVTSSMVSSKNVIIQYSTMDGTAIANNDYVAKSGSVTIPAGSTSASISITVYGDPNFEPDQSFLVNIAAQNATVARSQATCTLLNDDANLQFNSTSYSASESSPTVDLTVTRIGNLAKVVSVDYATSDSAGVSNCDSNGNAAARCDYEARFGTLRFASGETSKTVRISLVDDAYAEGNETFNVSLLNPVDVSIGPLAVVVTITITDNDSTNGSNPLANANFFVRQQYIDFLNREPDPSGLAFWSNQITECEQPGATCNADVRRVNVSAAFFLSTEFQETGYLAYKFYKAAYGNLGASPIPIRYEEFLPDTQSLGEGVVVGSGNWQAQLENNKQAFATKFVNRDRFILNYFQPPTPAEFVDRLYANAGVASPPAAERSAAINEFGGANNTSNFAARGRALRRVAENSTLGQQEFNRAFVLMQYFGYLRRNPYDPPEPTLDFQGYNFWLNKLNQFNGNFVNAEMVKGFLLSGEYRHRFAQ